MTSILAQKAVSARRVSRVIASGPVSSSYTGQVISNLDIEANGSPGVLVQHADVTIRNVRILHSGAHGIYGNNAPGLAVEYVEIENIGAPDVGAAASTQECNIYIWTCARASISHAKLLKGSSGIYAVNSPDTEYDNIEGYDFRGPYPRGQLVQWNNSPRGRLTNFSGTFDDTTSWPEDCINILYSDDVYISTGVVNGNNSPGGGGVVVEGSVGVVVEDVDAIYQLCGSFASATGSQDTIFRNCRSKWQRNEDLGRGLPRSNSLSFGSFGTDEDGVLVAGTRFENCQWYGNAHPGNIQWDKSTMAYSSIVQADFTPREPLAMEFVWRPRAVAPAPPSTVASAPASAPTITAQNPA